MIIYIDVIMLENFIINLFLLMVTMKLFKYKYYKTIYIAALVGAMYTLVLFTEYKFLTSFSFKLIMVLVMISITMKSLEFFKVIKASIGFVVSSFTLCGLAFSFSIAGESKYNFNYFAINNYSIKYIIISIMIFYIFIIRMIDYLKDRALIKNFIYDIEILSDDKKVLIRGLLDTGNGLREPVTNLPCIIIENNFIKEDTIKRKEEFLIPYNTVKEDGSLKGFKSDKVRVKGSDNIWRDVEVILCLCENKLSKENEFNALLSRGVI